VSKPKIKMLIIIGYIAMQYGALPELIPSHYGVGGEPDAFGKKSTLLLLLAITIGSYVGMFILNKFPHVFNYPTEVTSENARSLYKKATRMIRSLNTVIVVAMSYIIYATIQTAFNKQDGLGNYFMPVFLVSVFGVIIYYLIQSFRTAK